MTLQDENAVGPVVPQWVEDAVLVTAGAITLAVIVWWAGGVAALRGIFAVIS